MTNLAIKLNSLLSGGAIMHRMYSFVASGDVLPTIEMNSFTGQMFSFLINGLINLILKIVYLICTFVLNVIDFMQYLIGVLLGVSTSIDEYVVIDTRNPLIKLLTNSDVLKAFRLVIGISIVLIIVFAVYSIIRSEYDHVVNNPDEEVNSFGRIMSRVLRSLFTIGFFPLILLVSVLLVNAVLAGFNDILRGNQNVTLAGQIFMASAYNGNNYRNYADADTRVPIIINFEDPIYLGQGDAYSTEELYKFYKNFQPTGEELFDKFALNDFVSFNNTIVYKNNKIYNQQAYNGFEKFVCTREQYYVMADFIDYAVKNNLHFYIKNVKDIDINWKYVDESIYNKDENSLTITYKDASNLNDNKSYTVTYVPTSVDISSPISDAIKSIEALLGIGAYEDLNFTILKRLENSINVVEYETDLAYLKFSNEFIDELTKGNGNIINLNRATINDQLLLFEALRPNNTDFNFSIDDLISGVEYPVSRIIKRAYQPIKNEYVPYEEHYVVDINGTYYLVYKNTKLADNEGNLLRDKYNDYYYTLFESSFGLDFSSDIADTNKYNPNDIIDLGSYKNRQFGDSGKVAFVNVQNLSSTADVTNTSFSDITTEVQDGAYTIRDSETGEPYTALYKDTITQQIKRVSWPQKLINDLQVMLKEANINQKITDGTWLTDYSQFYPPSTGGDYNSNITKALIHPLGLILSELMLSNIEYSDAFNLYTNLTFTSKFDEETIDALILSMEGENNYFQLKAELEYFNEMFNVFMGPIIDEISHFEGFDMFDGEEASIYLYTYKAYLASVLISEQAATWFYNTAIALLGNINLAEDIVDDSTGYYLSFDELLGDELLGKFSKYGDIHNKTQSPLYLMYQNYKETLNSQQITESTPYYPEFMNALKNYLGIDKANFGNRLEMVLKSYQNKAGKEVTLNSYYDALKSAYNNILTLREAHRKNESFMLNDIINSLMMTPSIDDNQFTSANQDMLIQQLKIDINQIANTYESNLDYVYDDEETDNKKAMNDAIQAFIVAARNYANFKLEYIEEDNISNYNGQLKILESQVEQFIQELTKDDTKKSINTYKSFLEDKGIEFVEYKAIDDEEFVGEGVKNRAEKWSDYKNSVVAFYDAVMQYRDTEQNTEENTAMFDFWSRYAGNLYMYVQTQSLIDRLNRYYIVYGFNSIASTKTNLSLDLVVNNKHYTVGQNFTTAKFIEYVLGANYLNKLEYNCVFVEDGYNGLVSVTGAGDDQKVTSFTTLQKFLVDIGNMSAKLYQMTNLVNLSKAGYDELVVTAESNEFNLSKHILKYIVDNKYLPYDVVMALFGVDAESVEKFENADLSDEDRVVKLADQVIDSGETDLNELFNTVISYVLLTDNNSEKANYVDYSKMTLKDIRKACLNFLINYQKQDSESIDQNQRRYMIAFNLACSDWFYVSENNADKIGAYRNSWQEKMRETIAKKGGIIVDNQTEGVILRLAGLENCPPELLVSAEYTIDFARRGVDEANGDMFVICTFDDEIKQFIPFMMANKHDADENLIVDEDGLTWLSKYNYRAAYTDYYVNSEDENKDIFFPVIAKGIITADGKPTAIRENDGNIEFYRDDLVIHNVSEFGLSQYFLSVDQMQVHHTGISYVVNTFTKLFTGKSLVERMVEKVPRFAVKANLNLCYGTTQTIKDSLRDGSCNISYNFDKNISVKMDSVYTLGKMNILVLLIGVTSILAAIWKALWGVIARMFDITILSLIGPAVISTSVLSTDSKDSKTKAISENENQIYSTWRQTLTEKVLNVFAYTIGFNVFFIVVPIISKMTLFTDNTAFANIPLFRNISINFINEIIRLIFLIAASFLFTYGPELFSKITATANGFTAGSETYANVKGAVASAQDVWSGRRLSDNVANAVDSAKNMIPGYVFAQKLDEERKKEKRKQEINEKIAEASQEARRRGVSQDKIDAAAKQIAAQMNDKYKMQDRYKEGRRKAREERTKNRKK